MTVIHITTYYEGTFTTRAVACEQGPRHCNAPTVRVPYTDRWGRPSIARGVILPSGSVVGLGPNVRRALGVGCITGEGVRVAPAGATLQPGEAVSS